MTKKKETREEKTKRQSIDAGLFRILSHALMIAGTPEAHPNVVAYRIKKFLDSQGVVLKTITHESGSFKLEPLI